MPLPTVPVWRNDEVYSPDVLDTFDRDGLYSMVVLSRQVVSFSVGLGLKVRGWDERVSASSHHLDGNSLLHM